MSKWAIAIHGGAGGISHGTVTAPYEQALYNSLQAASDVLQAGHAPGSWSDVGIRPPPLALAAALAAVETMEKCPLFNAGSYDCAVQKGSAS